MFIYLRLSNFETSILNPRLYIKRKKIILNQANINMNLDIVDI